MNIAPRAEQVRLCSEALSKINCETITSFSDHSRAASACAISYERIYLKSLTIARWSFTRRYRWIAKLDDDRQADEHAIWAYRYMLPSDCINLIGVLSPPCGSDSSRFPMYNSCGKLDGYSVQYELRDGMIHSNYGQIFIDYQYRVNENELLKYPLFRDFLINLLASEFALSVMSDHELSKDYMHIAEDSRGLAFSNDASNNPTEICACSGTISRMRAYG